MQKLFTSHYLPPKSRAANKNHPQPFCPWQAMTQAQSKHNADIISLS
ncbi:hypothetical protein HPS8415995_1769 [Glaesserella parasuis 84-15995]|nr:hypothetical protein HPS8415995_1769 [Glaesserella parasuis 84-15995]